MQTDTQQDERLFLTQTEWQARKSDHEESLGSFLDPYLEKRSRQQKDPVLDFLFEYYTFRPSHLQRWSPGAGSILQVDQNSALPEHSELVIDGDIASLDLKLFPEKRVSSLKWTIGLLRKSGSRKPFFGCFGMHEWAMVYRADRVRHEQLPLRLSDDKIAEVVESRPLLCTHFDAFRFFTNRARPMNRNKLSRETFEENEQPGCVHTNMDLYKWAFKFYPWISGELIRDAFFNAVEARRIDMQASPYDVTKFGLEPIRIEHEVGRKEYLEKQTDIWERSMPIRERLISELETLVGLLD